jgi:predicted Fe-Mo cluster-binding NifX family protein
MKVAVPTSNGKSISKHVALSKFFYVYEDGKQVEKYENPLVDNLKESLVSLHTHDGRGLGAGRIIPSLLAQNGVRVFIAREIGEGMRANMQRMGIKCIETQEKNIEQALSAI